MNLIVVTPPPVEPVTLEEVYAHLRLDAGGSPTGHPDDALLETLIQSAREECEAATRRAFVEQTLRLILPRFSDPDNDGTTDAIELRRAPFSEIVAVRYYDAANELQTWDPANYIVANAAFVPVLRPVTSWPTHFTREDAVQIEYVVGYEPEGSPPTDYRANIPARIKQAILIGVQLGYDEIAPEKRTQLEQAQSRLLAGLTVHSFA
jgi:uncharacterized phiE125 gp8 family phage protein